MAIDVYLSEEKIKERVIELANKINKDYAGKEIVVVGVLNGAFMFCADLIRHINVPVTLDFIAASSYGEETESSGQVKIEWDLKNEIKGKHILLVEDIVDTGLTIKSLKALLGSREPASIKLASLLNLVELLVT